MKDGYILNVTSPFPADGKNDDAAIAERIFRNDDNDILNLLDDEDVIVVDRGCRDAIGAMVQCGSMVDIPNFLKSNE